MILEKDTQIKSYKSKLVKEQKEKQKLGIYETYVIFYYT